MAQLLSVNVGLPRDIEWRGQTVRTAVWKDPVRGRRVVRRLNIDGDGQGDLVGHGGEHRAVFVYQIDSYRHWEAELHRNDFVYGQFGENFTVEGLPDDKVCIGDRYKIGGAVFEVTQPRVTCYRVGIRMDEPRMAALLVSHARPGFYFRVLQEGEVEAGDEIVQLAEGPEGMTVAEVSALLYTAGHAPEALKRALRIPALSTGWRASFEALLERAVSGAPMTGNPGLTPEAGVRPAWTGFRPLRVSRLDRESKSVLSLVLEAEDHPLTAALPGQFLVLRLRPKSEAPALLRSYSLSSAPATDRYRISVKREAGGAASAYLHDQVKVGHVLEVSAPRGHFTLRPGDGPVVLLSAGVGATPVLAMLHALAKEASPREVWWLYGARDRADHPFAREARDLLQGLSRARGHVCYSRPGPEDRLGQDFDQPGRLSVSVISNLGVPRDADFYLCGPAPFMRDLSSGLRAFSAAPERIHTEIFGSLEASTPGVVGATRRPPHQPAGPRGSGPLVSFARSGVNVPWDVRFQSLLELAEACDVPVRWSCRTGVCHSCESGLVAGTVVYEPEPVEAPADGNLLICCSTPRGDLVIDL
ncbi:MAG TPA: sulfurase [Deltaproteobacteria bacterium]|nr:sulfurase [Deltaproteobacteria bacterium]